MKSQRKRTRSEVKDSGDVKKCKTRTRFQTSAVEAIPQSQPALILKAIGKPYEIISEHPVPSVDHHDELLVKVQAVGLNPIDWKAPYVSKHRGPSLHNLNGNSDYNFGIPTLPYVAGRELAGIVVKLLAKSNKRIKEGDVVIVPSTDYRDLRKAAFQHYCIASSCNTIRIPQGITTQSASIIGVAFVSAALALGTCMGLSFEGVEEGPDLLKLIHDVNSRDSKAVSPDIRAECLQGIRATERAKGGDFLVIWGGSSTCAFIMKQIARLFGLRIISVVNSAKHGLRLSTREAIRADLIVDSHDTERAVEVVRQATSNRARFGFDTQGKDTAAHLFRCLARPETAIASVAKDNKALQQDDTKLPTPPSTPHEKSVVGRHSHLVGLTGLPKREDAEGVVFHSVPIKLFHEVPAVGEALSAWCERLLLKGLLTPPDVVGVVDGLRGVNQGLDQMRRREISGGRLVADLT